MIRRLSKHITYTGMALLLSLLSCSEAGSIPNPDGSDEKRVPLRVAGASSGSGIGVQTRAGDRKTLTAGSIGVFLKEDAAGGYSSINNRLFTYGTPFWESESQILLGAPVATLAAYHPYAPGKSNPILLRSQKFSDAEDICYTNFQANKDVSSVTLNLERIYSRIVFNFSANYNGNVKHIMLQGEGIIPVAFFDMFDLDAGKTIRDILDPFTGVYGVNIPDINSSFAEGVVAKADCLMIPYQLEGDLAFTVNIDGTEMSGKVPVKELCGENGILLEGVKYEINVTVQAGFLQISSIRKLNWEEVDVDGDYEIH